MAMKDTLFNSMTSKKRNTILAIVGATLLAVFIGLFFVLQPSRTVANFCMTAKEEKPVLTGDVNYEKRSLIKEKLHERIERSYRETTQVLGEYRQEEWLVYGAVLRPSMD